MNDMSAYPASVTDEEGNLHYLLPGLLGEGGQGVVLRTKNPDIAVKLVGRSGVVDDAQRHAELRRRLENVRVLPLGELHLAVPLSMLKDRVGYTMRLLQGMVPIQSLIAGQGSADPAADYAAGGGLRRRLALLAKLAALLARLHAAPLIYRDISPNNVFVSASPEATELWLIDVDNLDYISNAPGIFTPGFGAPELVTGHGGPTTLSDAYSFALLAYQVLAQTHPFMGARVEEGGWDSDEDYESMAHQGKLAWVEDEEDASNRAVHGLPGDLVMTTDLRELFQRCFGPGRVDRAQRPSMAQWSETLQRVAAYTVCCGACGSTFYVSARTCPFCVAAPAPEFIHMQVHRWEPEIDDDPASSALSSRPVWHQMLDGESAIQRHVVEPVLAEAVDPVVLRVRVLAGGVAIEPVDGYEVYVMQNQQLVRLERAKTFPLPRPGQELYLHFGPREQSHRMAVLRHYGAGR